MEGGEAKWRTCARLPEREEEGKEDGEKEERKERKEDE